MKFAILRVTNPQGVEVKIRVPCESVLEVTEEPATPGTIFHGVDVQYPCPQCGHSMRLVHSPSEGPSYFKCYGVRDDKGCGYSRTFMACDPWGQA